MRCVMDERIYPDRRAADVGIYILDRSRAGVVTDRARRGEEGGETKEKRMHLFRPYMFSTLRAAHNVDPSRKTVKPHHCIIGSHIQSPYHLLRTLTFRARS